MFFRRAVPETAQESIFSLTEACRQEKDVLAHFLRLGTVQTEASTLAPPVEPNALCHSRIRSPSQMPWFRTPEVRTLASLNDTMMAFWLQFDLVLDLTFFIGREVLVVT